MELNKIKKQLRENMSLIDNEDYETFARINNKTILISFYKIPNSIEYKDYNMDHWVLQFNEEKLDKNKKEFWIPLHKEKITIDDIIEIIITYLNEEYFNTS